MSAYANFSNRQATTYSKRKMASLTRPRLYEVYKFEIAPNDFKTDGSTNLVAYFIDGRLRFRIILPSDLSNPPKDDVDKMNQHIAQKKPPSICFYGMTGLKYVVQIHEFGKGIDEDLLDLVNNIQAAEIESPQKKQSTESPQKKQSTPSTLKREQSWELSEDHTPLSTRKKRKYSGGFSGNDADA